jgi:hypothetical protein
MKIGGNAIPPSIQQNKTEKRFTGWMTGFLLSINKLMDDLIERTRQHLDEEHDGEQELLNEVISLRTGLIGAGLAKTKQYANQIDQEVRSLKGNAGKLKRSKNPENTNDALADTLETIGNLFHLNRKMVMYSALTAAATGMDSARQTKILRKMEKNSKRR